MTKLLIPVFIFILVSQSVIGQAEKTERPGEPDIYNVQSDDAELNAAIDKSRLSFNEFLAAFKNRKSSQTNFSVKMPFATETGAEHIWLTGLELKDEKLLGLVDNLPANVTSVKLGDQVEIEQDKISDWFYLDNGKLVGGNTIRVIRSRMKASERKKFDKQFGITID
jgi:uncharacterized protein YegJ (DUF2314 family)